MDIGAVVASLAQQLIHSQCCPADLLSRWTGVPTQGPVPQDLVRQTLDSLAQRFWWSALPLSEADLLRLSCQLSALDMVLALAEPSLLDHGYVLRLFAQIDDATTVLTTQGASCLLQPLRCSQSTRIATERLYEVLAVGVRIFARCCGVSKIGGHELLDLAKGDLATAVAIAVAVMRAPGFPKIARAEEQMWNALCTLSTPQVAAELAGQVSATVENQKTMAELLAEHVAHSNRLAACLIQFGALDAVCLGSAISGTAQQRAMILTSCLRALHNLAASPHCWSAGRLISRQLIALWSRLGLRLFAPHLRRLLSTACSGGKGAAQAASAFRGNMRTLGWLLHHAPELRSHMRPLCSELAMKVTTGAHPAETYAVVIGAAANSNALVQELGGTQLWTTLNSMDSSYKIAIQQGFPQETNKLWVITEAWGLIEDLGLWSGGSLQAPTAGDTYVDPGYEELGDDDEDDDDVEWFVWDDGATTSADEAILGELVVEELVAPTYDSAPKSTQSIRPTGDGTWELKRKARPIGRSPIQAICEAPKDVRCSIDGRLCTDPVTAVPGGPRFERGSIESWASRSSVCPITGSPLDVRTLIEDVGAAEFSAQWLVSS